MHSLQRKNKLRVRIRCGKLVFNTKWSISVTFHLICAQLVNIFPPGTRGKLAVLGSSFFSTSVRTIPSEYPAGIHEKTSDNYLNWLHFVPFWPAFKIRHPISLSWHFSVSANVSRQYNLHLFQLACPFFPFPFPFSSVLFHFPLFVPRPRTFHHGTEICHGRHFLGRQFNQSSIKEFLGDIRNFEFNVWRDKLLLKRPDCNATNSRRSRVSMFSSPIINENIQKINITLILSCECSDNNWKLYLCIYKSWNLTFRFIFKIKENEDILFFLCVIFIRSLQLLYKIFLIDIIHNS